MLHNYNIDPIRGVFLIVILYCTGISAGRKAGKLSALVSFMAVTVQAEVFLLFDTLQIFLKRWFRLASNSLPHQPLVCLSVTVCSAQ